ncbi:hypothetical protein GJ746_17645 [Klebsiella oxytoca]|uniref:Uncharacterized protein n=1 Tax=Klebsiella oxytoca TaxID=571 RepID=A0A6B8MRZ7_KLEOX|nr:hypothetical protein GJ746_17645 [Klebsiella oxytoca]
MSETDLNAVYGGP